MNWELSSVLQSANVSLTLTPWFSKAITSCVQKDIQQNYIFTEGITLNSGHWSSWSSLLLQIVDIGLGILDENAALVFSRLENVTNNTNTINSYANMNASVQVLSTLGNKLNNINNDSTVNVSIIFIECYCWILTNMGWCLYFPFKVIRFFSYSIYIQ